MAWPTFHPLRTSAIEVHKNQTATHIPPMVREKIFGLVKSDGHFQNTYGFCENSVALYPTVNPDDPNINIRKLVGGFNLPL